MGTQTDNRLRLFTPGGGKRLKLRGLRRRWLASSVGPIVIILVLTGILTAVTISSNLYGRARSTLEAKAKSGADYFSAYSMGSYSEYYRRAAQYTADFATSDSLGKTVELQFINGKRQVELSTRGAVAGSTPATMDVNRAVETGKTATFTGRDPLTGENILAVSSPLFYNGAVVGVMRYVTSTHLMDQQLWLTVLVIAAIIAAVIFLIFVSNLIFINNVVTPVAEVSEAAKRISSGSYGIQISNKYSDELGQLVDNINNMSLKISQSEKIQTEFISSVSHELRTPLTSIRGWVETLRTLDDPTDENYRKGLEIINNETARLYNMVEELLDFSRLQNGRLKMECRPLDLVAELTDAVLFCEARIQREGLLLAYAEPEEMIPVYADPDRLRQVFINILDNAIKYSAPGGRITVKIWQGEYKAFIEIIDQGRGIPPEDLENVKTKFYKGSNSVRGSGIGLALVDSIMTALDGTMDLKSTLGRGTVVTLGLPIYKR